MSRQYYDRYTEYIKDDTFRMIPNITIPIKGTDKYLQFKQGKDRLDKISQEIYGSPLYGWLILQANPFLRSIEFEIEDNTYIRIPYPLIDTLQDYKQEIDTYKFYYGE